VGSLLVAATANFAASQFTGSQFNGILSTTTATANGTASVYNPIFGCPSPTCPGAAVTVEAGAAITTNAPASAADRGGYVLLLGQTVRNDGQITTANGQTVLAAGQDFIVRDGYSGANNPTSTTLGLEVAPVGPGTVTNTGLI